MKTHFDAPQDDPLALVSARVHEAQGRARRVFALFQAARTTGLLVWIPERYDDGGISGGTLERPALQRLLADIDAGRVTMVVVYKIDRLTRALPISPRSSSASMRQAVRLSR